MIKIKSKGIRFLILIGVFMLVFMILRFILPETGVMWLALAAAAVGFFIADTNLVKVDGNKGAYSGD